jgi:hypothetical protein
MDDGNLKKSCMAIQTGSKTNTRAGDDNGGEGAGDPDNGYDLYVHTRIYQLLNGGRTRRNARVSKR